MHAAEASLSQLLNLMLAYVLLRGCGVGRSSAVAAMRIKFVSFVMVTLGLFLCTFEAERPRAHPHLGPAAAPAEPLGVVSASSALPYLSQTNLLLGQVAD